MIKKISVRLKKPRAKFLNSLLLTKSKRSGRMVNKKDKRLQSKLRKEMVDLES